jgi:hypothetical protein
MIEQFYIFADFHAVLSCGHAHRNLAERAGESRRDRFTTQVLKGSHSLLPKQNERIPVNGRGNIDNIRSRQICRDGRGPALININGARNHALNCHRRADLIDCDSETALGEIPSFECNEQRQARCSGAGGTDLQAGLFRLETDRLFRRPEIGWGNYQNH